MDVIICMDLSGTLSTFNLFLDTLRHDPITSFLQKHFPHHIDTYNIMLQNKYFIS